MDLTLKIQTIIRLNKSSKHPHDCGDEVTGTLEINVIEDTDIHEIGYVVQFVSSHMGAQSELFYDCLLRDRNLKKGESLELPFTYVNKAPASYTGRNLRCRPQIKPYVKDKNWKPDASLISTLKRYNPFSDITNDTGFKYFTSSPESFNFGLRNGYGKS